MPTPADPSPLAQLAELWAWVERERAMTAERDSHLTPSAEEIDVCIKAWRWQAETQPVPTGAKVGLHLADQLAASEAAREIGAEIMAIMATYREQEAAHHVDTPGGLEHMGDVWKLLAEWDDRLRALAAAPEPGPDGAAR